MKEWASICWAAGSLVQCLCVFTVVLCVIGRQPLSTSARLVDAAGWESTTQDRESDGTQQPAGESCTAEQGLEQLSNTWWHWHAVSNDTFHNKSEHSNNQDVQPTINRVSTVADRHQWWFPWLASTVHSAHVHMYTCMHEQCSCIEHCTVYIIHCTHACMCTVRESTVDSAQYVKGLGAFSCIAVRCDSRVITDWSNQLPGLKNRCTETNQQGGLILSVLDRLTLATRFQPEPLYWKLSCLLVSLNPKLVKK